MWEYNYDADKKGWYATIWSYEDWPSLDAHYFDGEKWIGPMSDCIYARSPSTFLTKKEAKEWAEEHDPDR